MAHTTHDALLINSADLNTVAGLISMRFSPRDQERERVARLRTLLAATSELNRSLAAYAQHALVHCHGTAGTSDLAADTAALDLALQIFCFEFGAVARDYDALVNGSEATMNASQYAEQFEPRDLMPWQ